MTITSSKAVAIRTGTWANEPRVATPSENGAPSASAATPTATTAIASAPRVQRSAIPPPAPGDSAPIGSRVGGRLPRTRVPVLRVGYLVGREANESLNVIDEQG